jgi:hypothetical protein
VDDACSYAWSKGVLLVAAAGNNNINMDIYPHYPASYETVMAISGTDSSDKRFFLSNYGSDIEVAAPGVMIPSTIPGNRYNYMTGTSMSTPHVAGVAALTWSYDPSLTNVQLRERLLEAVDDLGDPGWDPYFGYGRINAYKALTKAPEFEHNFRVSPFVDIVRFNVGPDHWLYGVIEGPGYSRPVLGKAEDGYGYFGCDLPPWADYEMAFFYISVTTGDGYMYRIRDDLSFTGPTPVWVTSATGGPAEGPTLVEGEGSEVAPATWYDLRMNPWTVVYHISNDIAPWRWGWCEASGPAFPAPVLGFTRGDRFFLATDVKDGTTGYEILFEAGTRSTGKGSLIVTNDGYGYAGPYNFWFTIESSEIE